MSENPISVRNLQDGFAGTPLRKFTGILDNYMSEPATGYDGTRVALNFREVSVLQSIEPYNFPIATLNLGYSNRKKSRWGYFGDSLATFLPDDQDIADCREKLFGMVYCDGEEGRPAPEPIWQKEADKAQYPTGEVPTPVWKVYELDGTVGSGPSTVTAEDRAKELLDGKALSQFNSSAYADDLIRKNPELQRAITDKSFIKLMLSTGEFVKDENDIYHRSTSAPVEDSPF